MELNIKNPRTERLAQELARATGTSLTEAVTIALEARLAAVQRAEAPRAPLDDVLAIQAFLRAQPDRDTRPADEILDYDDTGLPR